MRSVSRDEAVAVLRAGGLVVHPTEAVYGIGGALAPEPTRRLRSAKDRSQEGFVLLLPSDDGARDLLTPEASKLAAAFWPGALTLILDDPEHRFPTDVKAADGSVAVRRCGNAGTNRLVDALGGPITSTSANPPGGRPACTFREALAAATALGLDAVGLDGGNLKGGAPSTIVDARSTPVRVLREGAVPAAEIRRVAKQQARNR